MTNPPGHFCDRVKVAVSGVLGTHAPGMNETQQIYAQWLDELDGATAPAPETVGVMAPMLVRDTATRDVVILSIIDPDLTAEHMAVLMDVPYDPVSVYYSATAIRRALLSGGQEVKDRVRRAVGMLDGCMDTPEYHAVMAYLAWFGRLPSLDREIDAAGDGGRFSPMLELAQQGRLRGIYPGDMAKA